MNAEHLIRFLKGVGRKLALFVTIYLIASMALFMAIRAIPGDPIALRLKNPDPVRVAKERERLGLDKPVMTQYVLYGKSFWTGDWGRSLLSGRKVREDVAQFFPATLELSLAGLSLGIIIGVLTAVFAEGFRSQWLKRFSFFLGTLGLTVPIFWIGLLALIVGSLWLGWFPSGGRFDLSMVPPPNVTGSLLIDSLLAGQWEKFWAAVNHLVLPAICLSLYPAAQVCSVLQARLQDPKIEILKRALKARGFGPARIWFRHLLKVGSAPVVTVIGTSFGALLGGAVLTETVFSWPGIGRYMVAAVLDRDLYVVQNVLLLVILLVVGVVFITDFLAHVINPVATKSEEDQ
ncbi:MAG: ABC transporter permease [Opitutaceae bacterium]|nr:ABC transporter permease [Opitutaceae bacterium]